MADDRNLSRVRFAALLLMIGVGAELVRYVYRSVERAMTFSFWEPEKWNNHRLVDPETIIGFGPRLGYLAIWGTVILLSVAAFIASLYLLNHIRRGQIFELQTAKAVTWLGLILCVAMVADLIFHSVDPWLITHANVEPRSIRWGYDPSDIKTLAMAAVFFLFGWVMHQSIDVDRENREFV